MGVCETLLPAVSMPTFTPFHLLRPFQRFALIRIGGQQRVVEKSDTRQKLIPCTGKRLPERRSVAEVYKSNLQVLFILLLKYLLTDNKG